MDEDGLDELPPDLRAAWLEAAAAREDTPEPAQPVPPQDTPAPVAPTRPADEVALRSPTRTVPRLLDLAPLPVVLGLVLGAKHLGLGGWRAGGTLVAVGLTGVALALSLLLTRGLHLRAAYVVGTVVVALLGSAWCVSTAPLSHGRLGEVLDAIPAVGLVEGPSERRGHGWCSPRCPTVTRTYLAPGRRPGTAMEAMVVALDRGGLIPKDAGRVAYTRSVGYAVASQAVSIDHQRYTTVLRAEPDASPAAAGGSRVTVEITSRRGVRERPLTPVRAR